MCPLGATLTVGVEESFGSCRNARPGRLDVAAAEELQARRHELPTDAYATGDLDTALAT